MGLGELWVSGSQLWPLNVELAQMTRVFVAASWCPSDRMVAKGIILTLIVGIGELIGMTPFKSSGSTCAQMTKDTKS